MSVTVRLPLRVEQELQAYCAAKRITKSEAVKQALERLLSEPAVQSSPYDLGKKGFRADRSPGGDVARNSKRLIRERFRGKPHR